MKKMIARMNRTLFELEVGILIFGVVCQLLVFLSEDKTGYSIGLWIGIATAAIAAFHMWWSLEKGLDFGEKAAVSYLSKQNIIRYVLIVAVIVFVAVTKIGSPLSAFLGIMGLKAAAYMQLLTRKISRCIYGEEVLPKLIEEPDEGQE